MKESIYPTREAFRSLAAEGKNLIAVQKPIALDFDTTVSVYYKLVGEGEPGFLLESADTTHQAFGRYSFVGAEPFVRLRVYPSYLEIRERRPDGSVQESCLSGAPRDTLKRYMAGHRAAVFDRELPLANGGLVGYLNYEIVSTFDRVRGLELREDTLLGEFQLCRILVILDTLRKEARLVCLAAVPEGADAASVEDCYERACADLRAAEAKINRPLPAACYARPESQREKPLDFLAKYGEPPAEFIHAIELAKEHIAAGDIFQVVPSRAFRAELTQSPMAFYRRLRQVNPSPYMFFLDFGGVKLVGASPETLVKVLGHTVSTYPIAGTRRRGKNAAEDAALARDLHGDEKEVAEHSMLVDLARNDIGRIAEPGSVQVVKLKEIEKFSHVMHMVSEVQGTLRAGLTPMDVLATSFPAGTVSGAPKLRAMEIIHDLEPVPRGTYSGAVGYMDFAGNMDMCITLRTMRIEHAADGDTAVIQSGAGIVADSVPEREYREILQKSRALFEVVEEVENECCF